MELNMKDEVVQGLIAAVVTHADTGDMHGFRLEVRGADGQLVTYLSDTSMMRSHNDTGPMTLNAAIRLIEGAGLRVFEPAHQVKAG